MPKAARKQDATTHGSPLNPGPASPNVNIGYAKAWRALPAGVGAGLESASNAMKGMMDSPALSPVAATATIAQVQSGLSQAATAAGANGNGAAAGGVSSAMATLNATNAKLTVTHTTATAAPGGEPAATQAYTEGIKAAAGGAAAAAVSSIAAGIADIHNCPTPSGPVPHGPGVVTKGCATVFINKLPAARKDDQVFEAAGGADPIAAGCPTVNIGDLAGGGGGGGGGAGQTVESDADSSTTAVGAAADHGGHGDQAGPSAGSDDSSPIEQALFGQSFEEEEEFVAVEPDDPPSRLPEPKDHGDDQPPPEPQEEKGWFAELWGKFVDWLRWLFKGDEPKEPKQPPPLDPGGGGADDGEFEENIQL